MAAVSGSAAVAVDGTETAGVRVGVYDSRALAVAWVHSDLHEQELRALHEEHAQAKASGDRERVQDLEARGQAMQEAAHRQVFGNAPVEDVLEIMKDALPGIARDAGVDVIVRTWDVTWQDPAAQVVDITDRMVDWFHPDAKALKIISQIRTAPVIPQKDLDRMNHSHD
jgi:hypothetical protein